MSLASQYSPRASADFDRGPLFSALLLVCLLFTGCNNDKPAPKPGSDGDPDAQGGQAKELTEADFRTVLALRNRAISHLENMEWSGIEETWTALSKVLPKSPMVRRNHAIGRTLSIVAANSPYKRNSSAERKEYDAAFKGAREAVAAFRKVADTDYDRSLADLMDGMLLTFDAADISEGLALLKKAAAAQPEAPDFQCAVAVAMDGHRDYQNANKPGAGELIKAYQKVQRLVPDNIYVALRLLKCQAACLNSSVPENKELAVQITETMKSTLKLIRPMNDSLPKQGKNTVVDLIENGLAKFEEGGDPRVLMAPGMITENMVRPEIVNHIDRRRVSRSLLEYVVLDLEPEFMLAAEAAGAIDKPAPSVLKSLSSSDAVPQIQGVTRLQIADMNLDGYEDIVVARNGSIEVYSRGNQPEWTLLVTVTGDQPLTGFLLADIDRDDDKAISELKVPMLLRDADGDQRIKDPAGKNRWYDTDFDLVVWGGGLVSVYHNDTDGSSCSFSRLESSITVDGNVTDAVATDLEADGDLDLAIATDTGLSLWRNLNGKSFENTDSLASLPEYGLSALVAVDWDQNVSMDIVAVAADGRCGVLENILHGRFRWFELPNRVPLKDGATINNARLHGPDINGRYQVYCSGAGTSAAITSPAEVRQDQQAAASTDQLFADLDNNGVRDQIIFGGADSPLTISIDETEVDEVFASTGIAFDTDDDGDLDLIYVDANDGSLGLLINEGGNSNNWITICARGKPDDPQFKSQRVNLHGVGSVIEIRSGSQYQAQVITGPKIHIGLGSAKTVDTIRIIWTDGVPQHINVPRLLNARYAVLAPQILSGSCPYLYTWTGERFEFFSDCLWAAPLGLVQANGELTPTREWEHLLIPGSALVEKDGQYVIQITEELHEIAYFDHVELVAIDHPKGTEVFTNEKVGPPSLAEHRVHTVKQPRWPASITDGRGNDLLPGLKHIDGEYVQAFESRIMQGLTDSWTMEFDLGSLKDPQDVRLFLTGWVFPTDTSLNEGIRQNPDLAPPAPPSIQVPDENGGWKTVRPFIGFPSGKTKAMVVDLSGIVSASNSRFRMSSSMELYWDQAFYTINEGDAPVEAQSCELQSTHLHYRGFSRRMYSDQALFRNGRAPESYDYSSVRTKQMWSPISGPFTRYGNVDPLLLAHDDQLVVMGPGDELTVRFAVPAQPVPEGWERDFVLRNVGYDKDANLNTIYGQSSQPLPFRAMSQYPFAPQDQAPDSDEYREYIEQWQTREYPAKPFWNTVRRAALQQ